ncbi:MATE family efflux transporter [Eisenbergiella porci]|uniref:MATE family efflux transporter n=1 Tax=Eisenbergiella porci TaxID=2652274 RepID=UPI002A832074|nr:MATE family efflux transporter [Eisenbergiella porci]
MKETQNFTKGNILTSLVRFALPVLAALFLQTMYGAVDMLVVGRFATAADVSAVSTGSWLMQLITSFVVGIAMGTTVLLGRRLGEGKPEEAGKIIGASIVLFAIIGVVITFFMELCAVPVAQIMRTPIEAFDATVLYVRICSAGSVFIVAYNVLGSIFRGIGDSRMPLVTVAIACVFNIAGDFLLVGVFGMATAGAAIATVLAQALSVIISVIIIRRQKLPFTFRRTDIVFDRKRMGSVFRLGLPIAFQDLLVSISFLAITAIVNSLGVIPSAGVGVAEKLCGFIMLVPSAFNQSMSAFVAQNMGAGRMDRAKRALLCGIGMSLVVGVFMAWLSFFHGDLLAGLFARDEAVIAAAADYLKAYAIDCLLVSVMFCMIGYFNGCGKTLFVMLQGIAGAFGVRIPVSLIMSRIKPVSLFKVGLATPCSSVVQIILCVGYFLLLSRRKPKKEAEE